MTEIAFEFVEDAIVFVEIAQLGAEIVVDADGLDRLRLHVQIPDLEREIVTRQDVSAVSAEFDVRNRGDDLREEGFGAGILFLLENFGGGVAEGGGAHVA